MLSRSVDDALLGLIDIQCRCMSFTGDKSLQNDLKHVTSEVKQLIPPDVVDVVLEMNGAMRQGVMNERLADRKAPWVVASNLYNGTWNLSQKEQEDAKTICDEKLSKPLGHDRANKILEVCIHKCWAEQNSEDYETATGGRVTGSRWGYKDDAIKDELYAQYLGKQMGFSTYPEISKDVCVKLLCYYRSRYWTAENVEETHSELDYGPKSRQAAFDIATKRTKAVFDNDELVDTITDLAVHWRAYAHWDRAKDGPLFQRAVATVISVGGLLSGSEETVDEHKEAAMKGAQRCREELRTKWPAEIGDKADILYELCEYCAWHEQNKVDYDRSSFDVTGGSEGYREESRQNYRDMELTSYKLCLK